MTRNKKLVKLMALTVAASTVATSVPAYAAFDATYYAQQNPDVVAAIGTKPADLETHYNVFGKKEGRAGSADEAGSALRQLFDAAFYAKMNPDVVAVLGNDPNALFDHFLKFGIKEGRRINPYFDVNAYMKAYPDLVAAFGDDIAAYYNHFANHGISEHRTLGGFPAEKIVPGGSVAYSGGESSSSSGGGGGSSSSKPAPKPADVTPTPDPTPTPQPEPTPVVPDTQEAAESIVLIEAANDIKDSNDDLAADIDEFYDPSTLRQLPITESAKASLVGRALNNLNDADALKAVTAENLAQAQAEKEAADKALIDANNAVKEAASTNRALSAFTDNSDTYKQVGTALSGYYAALEAASIAQKAADIAAADLAAAKANDEAAKKVYDSAFANVKSALEAIDSDTYDSTYFKGKTDIVIANALAREAGYQWTDAGSPGDGIVAIADVDATTATLVKAEGATEFTTAFSTYSQMKADQLKGKIAQVNEVARQLSGATSTTTVKLITDTGDVSKSVYGQIERKLTTGTKKDALALAQSVFINAYLANDTGVGSIYVDEGTGGSHSWKFKPEAIAKLQSFGLTDNQITTMEGTLGSGATPTVPTSITDTALKTTAYASVASTLTADSPEIKNSSFTVSGGVITAMTNSTDTSGVTYADYLADKEKDALKPLVTAINQYNAVVAGVAYLDAYDAINKTDPTPADAVNESGTKEDVANKEITKASADADLKDAEDALKDANQAVLDAQEIRDEAYAAAGVAGNAVLEARDDAQEDAAREAYEEAKATEANNLAKQAYNNAMNNYADASKLDTDVKATTTP